MMKKRIKFTRLVLVFFLILAWIFMGGPGILNFSLGIQEARGVIFVGPPSTNSCHCNQLTISSHSISGPNPLVLVGVNLENGGSSKTVNTVIYNSIALTQLVEIPGGNGGNKSRSEIWYLDPSSNPGNGSYDVVITIDGSHSNKMSAGVITFNGVDQSNPIDTGTVQSNGAKSTSDTLTVASQSGDLVMDIVSVRHNTKTPDGSQTEQWDLDMGGSGKYGGASTKEGSASVAMVYTFGRNKDFSHAAFNINAAGGAVSYSPPPPPPPQFRRNPGAIRRNPGPIIQRPRDIR